MRDLRKLAINIHCEIRDALARGVPDQHVPDLAVVLLKAELRNAVKAAIEDAATIVELGFDSRPGYKKRMIEAIRKLRE